MENKILETIKSIFLANNYQNLLLSGSAALKLQNIFLRREPSDIDILLIDRREIICPPGMNPTGTYDSELYDYEDEENDKPELPYKITEYNYKGIKIDVFTPRFDMFDPSPSHIQSLPGSNIKMLVFSEIMKFKIEHAYGKAYSKGKHKDDLIYSLVNISEKNQNPTDEQAINF